MTSGVKPGGMVVCLETSQPTLIGYKQLYYFYFRFIMPIVWKAICKKLSGIFMAAGISTRFSGNERTCKQCLKKQDYRM